MSRKPTVATAKTTKLILVLPCSGSPFIWKSKLFNTKTKDGKADLHHELKKVCRGSVEKADPKMMVIHPVFENRWRIANILRSKDDVEMYLNEDGMNECCPNMATLRLERDVPSGKSITLAEYNKAPLRVARVPYFGDVALVMSYKTVKDEIDPEAMKLVRVEDFYKELGFKMPDAVADWDDYESSLGGYIYEPEDDKDAKTFKEFATTKGWHCGSMGMVYMKPTGRDDEKESTSDNEDEEDDE